MSKITISSPTEGATLFYTTDGSTPTSSSTLYTTEFEIVEGVVSAIATKDGYLDSEIATQTVLSPESQIVSAKVGDTVTLDGIECLVVATDITIEGSEHNAIAVDKNYDLGKYVNYLGETQDGYEIENGTLWRWGGYGTSMGTSTGTGYGLQNTETCLANESAFAGGSTSNTSYPLLWQGVKDFREIYGSNWFVPSQEEITEYIYPYAESLSYDSETGADSSANSYWSDSEYSGSRGYTVNLSTGSSSASYKYATSNVRMCRAFTVDVQEEGETVAITPEIELIITASEDYSTATYTVNILNFSQFSDSTTFMLHVDYPVDSIGWFDDLGIGYTSTYSRTITQLDVTGKTVTFSAYVTAYVGEEVIGVSETKSVTFTFTEAGEVYDEASANSVVGETYTHDGIEVVCIYNGESETETNTHMVLFVDKNYNLDHYISTSEGWSFGFDGEVVGTGTAIGAGEANTAELVLRTGSTDYVWKTLSEEFRPIYSDDWFVMSLEEAKLIPNYIENAGIILTSSENGDSFYYALDGSTVADTASKSLPYPEWRLGFRITYDCVSTDTPTISFNSSTQYVTLNCETDGSTIYYATSIEGEDSGFGNYQTYSEPFYIQRKTWVKAYASVTGGVSGVNYSDSAEIVEVCTKTVIPDTPSTPTASITAYTSNSITLDCSVTSPTVEGEVYSYEVHLGNLTGGEVEFNISREEALAGTYTYTHSGTLPLIEFSDATYYADASYAYMTVTAINEYWDSQEVTATGTNDYFTVRLSTDPGVIKAFDYTLPYYATSGAVTTYTEDYMSGDSLAFGVTGLPYEVSNTNADPCLTVADTGSYTFERTTEVDVDVDTNVSFDDYTVICEDSLAANEEGLILKADTLSNFMLMLSSYASGTDTVETETNLNQLINVSCEIEEPELNVDGSIHNLTSIVESITPENSTLPTTNLFFLDMYLCTELPEPEFIIHVSEGAGFIMVTNYIYSVTYTAYYYDVTSEETVEIGTLSGGYLDLSGTSITGDTLVIVYAVWDELTSSASKTMNGTYAITDYIEVESGTSISITATTSEVNDIIVATFSVEIGTPLEITPDAMYLYDSETYLSSTNFSTNADTGNFQFSVSFDIGDSEELYLEENLNLSLAGYVDYNSIGTVSSPMTFTLAEIQQLIDGEVQSVTKNTSTYQDLYVAYTMYV